MHTWQVISHLITISLLWYVNKSIITGSKSVSKKPMVSIIMYSFYTAVLALGSLWFYTTNGNSYQLILAAYAAVAGVSIWIFRFYYTRKANYARA